MLQIPVIALLTFQEPGCLPMPDGSDPELMQGTIGIANDVTIHGHLEGCNVILHNMTKVVHKHGLVFSVDRGAIKARYFKLLWCICDIDSAHHCPEKVATIHDMACLLNITQLQDFLGIAICT